MPKRSEGAPKGPGLRRAIKWEVLATKREIEADIPSLRLTGGLRLARCRAGRLRLTPPSRREGRGEGKTPSSGPQARPRKRELWGGTPEATPARSAWGLRARRARYPPCAEEKRIRAQTAAEAARVVAAFAAKQPGQRAKRAPRMAQTMRGEPERMRERASAAKRSSPRAHLRAFAAKFGAIQTAP